MPHPRNAKRQPGRPRPAPGLRPGGGTARPPRLVLGGLAIVLAAFAVYLPSLPGGYLWDDAAYVTDNPHLESASGLRALWLTPGATTQYYPVTFTALWLQHQLWGDNPLGYRAVNVALHALCALLLWRVLHLLSLRGAWLAAALFVVHPVFVESVAWIAELKNMLSLALYLGCLLAYLRVRPPDAPGAAAAPRGNAGYAVALALFAAALLAKPAAVLLPLVILALVWWKRGRLRAGDVGPVVPMLLMGLAMGLVTIWAEREFSGAGDGAAGMSLLARAGVAGRALWFYAGTLAAPIELIPVYPRWEVEAFHWAHLLWTTAAAAAAATLWLLRARLGRGLLAALICYALLLFPALGFFEIAYFRYSFVADHFQYHAAPALLAAVAAGAAALLARPRWRTPVAVGAATALVALSALTWRHAHAFASEKARCSDILAKHPSSWVAMNNLGESLASEGRQQEAIRLYEAALQHNGDYPEAHNNLGVALATRGDARGARDHFQAAVRLMPDYAEAHNNLGALAALSGDRDGAIRHYQRAITLRPSYAKAHLGIAEALLGAGRAGEAAVHLEAALRIDPGNAAARRALERARLVERRSTSPDRR